MILGGKQIAGDIGISETTVNVHRSNLMHKMKAASIAELGRMADKLNLIADKPQICRPNGALRGRGPGAANPAQVFR